MHINSDENFNLLAAKDMSLIATDKMISSADSINTATGYYNTYSHPLFVSGRTNSTSPQPIEIKRTSDNASLGSVGNVLQQDGDSGTYDFFAVILPPGYSLQSSSSFSVEFAIPKGWRTYRS